MRPGGRAVLMRIPQHKSTMVCGRITPSDQGADLSVVRACRKHPGANRGRRRMAPASGSGSSPDRKDFDHLRMILSRSSTATAQAR
jgi:hypothetical protein